MASIIDKIFDTTTNGIEKAMDLTWRRNEAISSNIANAETPLYRASDVTFAKELEKAFGQQDKLIAKTNARHLDTSGGNMAHLVPDYTGATKADGNNVDIDIQMGKLAQNSGQYSSASNLLRKKLGLLKRVITEGSR